MLVNFKIRQIFEQILCALSFVLCVIPGFKLLGNLFYQITITAVLALIIILIFDLLFKTKPKTFSISLLIMTVFWVLFSIFNQINIHIINSDKSFSWIHLFYYDRPTMLFIVFFTSIIYFIVKLLFKYNDTNFIKDYSCFCRLTIKIFLAFYALILFYSFFLVRKITWTCNEYNLIPFETIAFTFSRGYIDYELFFLFLGNIAIFLPLGVLISLLSKNKAILIFTPILLSGVIEVSQYFLGNGHPDIDDFILNVIGFYLGALFKVIMDYAVYKASKGKLNSFFIMDK